MEKSLEQLEAEAEHAWNELQAAKQTADKLRDVWCGKNDSVSAAKITRQLDGMRADIRAEILAEMSAKQ